MESGKPGRPEGRGEPQAGGAVPAGGAQPGRGEPRAGGAQRAGGGRLGRGDLRALRGPLALAIIIATAAFFLISCAEKSAPSFPAGLARLDGLLAGTASAPEIAKTYNWVYTLARDSTQWLSLAKRSPLAEARGDAKRGSKTADAALRAFPANEGLATAAAWLFLRDGLPEKALALFPSPLNRVRHSDLWVEARLSVAATRPVSDQEDCRVIAAATGDPSWLIEAALLAMKAGDRFAAQAWLRESIREGGQPTTALLWDAGLNDEILAGIKPRAGMTSAAIDGPVPPLSASDAALAADAAWIDGDKQVAMDLWNRAMGAGSGASWQTEIALAVVQPMGERALADARSLALRFGSRPEALRYAAALLLREGSPSEALALAPALEKGAVLLPEALGIELDSERQGEGRFIARAIRLAEEHRDDPAAREFALRVLLAHGRWDEYLVLYDGASKGDRADPSWWYWAMAADILRGDYPSAEARAKEAAIGQGGAGLQLAFAQGMVAALEGQGDVAEGFFRDALALSGSGKERAAALKEIGRLEAKAGRNGQALASYAAAEEADPGDVEARLLASGVSR